MVTEINTAIYGHKIAYFHIWSYNDAHSESLLHVSVHTSLTQIWLGRHSWWVLHVSRVSPSDGTILCTVNSTDEL